MRMLLAALALAIATPTFAQELRPHWTWADTVLEASLAAVVVWDIHETEKALARGSSELNPALGSHPSTLRLHGFATAAVIGHAAVSYVIPPGKWRRTWQIGSLVVESLVAAYTTRSAEMPMPTISGPRPAGRGHRQLALTLRW